MGYLPQFRNDIFISYRHVSNDGQDRWVDAFCEQLRTHLAELVGDIAIWRDQAELRAGDVWRQEIADALDHTAIFLAIVTGTYFDSDVCRTELDQFLGRLKEAGGAQGRIVPIFKQPPANAAELPPELGEFEHHRFFEFQPKGSTRFQEFRPDPDAETAPLFASTLAALAQDLREALQLLKGIARAQAIGTVYLAEVGPELHAERERLRTDLQQRGYLVVPERRYVWNAANFGETIARDLDAARACIHLVSRVDSVDRTAADRTRRQLDLAVAAMSRRSLPPPLVWIQPAPTTSPGAQTLVDYVERELSNTGVEYAVGGLEDFKTQIYETLAAGATAAPTEVAIVVDDGDLEASGVLMDRLARLGYEPRRVRVSGGVPRDAAAAARTLARCERALVFWGGQSEDWLGDVLALAPLAPFAADRRLGIYAAPPATPEKATFRSSRARILGDDDQALRQFVAGPER